MTAVLNHVPAVRQLDFLSVDFFKPRNERERNRLRLHRTGAEYKQRRVRSGRWCGFDLGSLRSSQLRRHVRAERLRDAVRVDDHNHGTVAKNGVSREHRDMAQLARHRLHDDFLGMENAVDDYAKSLAADRGDDDKPAGEFADVLIEAEQMAEADKRQQLVA